MEIQKYRRRDYLFEDDSFIDLLPGNVTDFQDAQGESFERRIQDELGVMNIQTREDGLCQRMTFQPGDLQRDRQSI